MKKLLPLLLLLIGTGAGVGAGIFLRPDPEPQAATEDAVPAEEPETSTENMKARTENPDAGVEYVKMSNQFVVPVVHDDEIAALVVLSLSIETVEGQSDAVFAREPKLRDAFLQALFDHANIGGFDGEFTSSGTLDILRRALREVAQKLMGPEMIHDVLITEIARQDY